MSLRRSRPGVRSGFLETPRTRFGGVFLASAQTAFLLRSFPTCVGRVRHRSEAVDIDVGQLVGRCLKIAGSYAPERPPQAATPNSTPQTPCRVRPNPDHPRRREVARRYCVARNTPCLAATSPLSGPAVRFFGEVSRTTAPNRPGSHPISRVPTYFQPANIPAGGVTEGFSPVADAVPWRFSRAFQLAAIGGDLTVFRRGGPG